MGGFFSHSRFQVSWLSPQIPYLLSLSFSLQSSLVFIVFALFNCSIRFADQNWIDRIESKLSSIGKSTFYRFFLFVGFLFFVIRVSFLIFWIVKISNFYFIFGQDTPLVDMLLCHNQLQNQILSNSMQSHLCFYSIKTNLQNLVQLIWAKHESKMKER